MPKYVSWQNVKIFIVIR